MEQKIKKNNNEAGENNSQKAIEVRNLKKHYGEVKAVNGISFYVKENQVFTLLGPNGAGKTTTIEILEGLMEKDGGELYFFGERCQRIGRRQKEEIGVLLQQNNFVELTQVEELLDLFASFYSTTIPATEILDIVELQDKAEAYVEDLSGGQQQRLAIGLALINDPKILFLDEPTTGLDPQARRNIWQLIQNLRSQGKTIFLTTHYMEEAEELSDYVYIMDRGEIIARGTPLELIAKLDRENIIVFADRNLQGDSISELENIFPQVDVDDEQVELHVKDLSESMAKLFDWSKKQEQTLDELRIRRPNLEDVFLDLTGKELRE